MEQTECSETSAYKIQTPGITQKNTYNFAFANIEVTQRTKLNCVLVDW